MFLNVVLAAIILNRIFLSSSNVFNNIHPCEVRLDQANEIYLSFYFGEEMNRVRLCGFFAIAFTPAYAIDCVSIFFSFHL